MSNQTRVRKSFSMNDMKSFIMHERKVEQQHLLQHQQREVELVPITEPLRQALKSAKLLKSGQITHSVTTPTLSPNSSLTKSLTNDDNIEEEESSLGCGWHKKNTHLKFALRLCQPHQKASKMWLTPSIIHSNRINFLKLGSKTGLSIHNDAVVI